MVVRCADPHRTEDAFLISVRFRNCEEPRIYRAHCWHVQWPTRPIGGDTSALTLRTSSLTESKPDSMCRLRGHKELSATALLAHHLRRYVRRGERVTYRVQNLT